MHHVPQAGLTALAVAGPVERGVRHRLAKTASAWMRALLFAAWHGMGAMHQQRCKWSLLRLGLRGRLSLLEVPDCCHGRGHTDRGEERPDVWRRRVRHDPMCVPGFKQEYAGEQGDTPGNLGPATKLFFHGIEANASGALGHYDLQETPATTGVVRCGA